MNSPKAATGGSHDTVLAAKAADVVKDVTSMAPEARRYAYTSHQHHIAVPGVVPILTPARHGLGEGWDELRWLDRGASPPREGLLPGVGKHVDIVAGDPEHDEGDEKLEHTEPLLGPTQGQG